MLGKVEGRRIMGKQDEMVGWHHRLDGQEFEQAPGTGEETGRSTAVHEDTKNQTRLSN